MSLQKMMVGPIYNFKGRAGDNLTLYAALNSGQSPDTSGSTNLYI